MPAFQPYWGKPAVRNDRGDGGNVGIIRSPLRATVLPDYGGQPVMVVHTVTPSSVFGDSHFRELRRWLVGSLRKSLAQPRRRNG